MKEYIEAVIGSVKKIPGGWEIALAPDNTTWLTMPKVDKELGIGHGEPMVGNIVKIRVPRVVAHWRPVDA